MRPWVGDVILKPYGKEVTSNVDSEIQELQSWLANRPSATMDPAFDKRVIKRNRLRELLAEKRTTIRPPTNMMAAQQMSEWDSGELP
jgi:hypothetical protein